MVLTALAGLVLAFGGACGAGPTSLPLLAVAGTQTPAPDDGRGQVPVPIAAEVAQPTSRRIVRRAAGRLARIVRGRRRRTAGTWTAGVVLRRGPPPLRGPPALVS